MFDMITFMPTEEKLQYHISNNHKEITENQWIDISINNSIYKYGWNAYDVDDVKMVQFIVYFDLNLNLYDIFFNNKGEIIKIYQYHDNIIEYDIILLNSFNKNKLKFKTLKTNKRTFNKLNKEILITDLREVYSNNKTNIFKSKLVNFLKEELNLDSNMSVEDIFEIEDAQNMISELICSFANEVVIEKMFNGFSKFAEIKDIEIGDSITHSFPNNNLYNMESKNKLNTSVPSSLEWKWNK